MAATCGRRNGLVSSSMPMVVGSVGLPAARSWSTSLARFCSAAFSGSMVSAKLGVGLRVLVAAVDRRVLRQRHQLLQRLPHHLRVALDHAAAADGEQRVAGEGHLGRWEHIGDVAGGVAGRIEHPHLVRAERERVALAHLLVDAGDLGRLVARADDGALGLGLERSVAVGVVGVVVRGENVRELPALFLQRRRHGCGVRRVDGGREAGAGIVDQHAVIVGKTGELVNLELWPWALLSCFRLHFCCRAAP